MKHFRTLALASAALLISTAAQAAPPNSTINGLAAGNVPVTLGAVTDGTLKSPTHGAVDSTGAVVNPASSDNQTAIQATAGSSSSKAVGVQGVSGGVAVGVSAASLPLPTGAATSANQSTEITSLGTIATNSGTQATAANQATANASLATIASNSGGPIPAGTNVIGHVIADTGSTTAVTALPALAAGTAIVGKVGIDQTTDGTTNAVHLVAGTAVAGKFGIDQTTPGTTNAVAIGDGSSVTLGSKADAATCATANTAMACFRQLHADVTTAIPAGANLIGKVGIDQTTPGSTNAVVVTPATSGGLAFCRVVTGTTGFCKASAGQVFQIVYQNTNAAARYIQLYNKASAPTVGTDVPIATVPMALTSVGGYNFTDLGAAFSTGIAWAVTTDDVATPTTAGASGDLHMTLSYK